MTDERRAKREQAMLDAAVRLLASEGRGGVTHRAVAAEAGVPLGATTYYFESRDDLLERAFARWAEVETARFADEDRRLARVRSPRGLADGLIDSIAEAVVPDRSYYIAEYELWLEAARRPELRPTAARWCEDEVALLRTHLERLGSSDPGRDATILGATLDGFAEQVLIADDPVEQADALRPHMRRLVGALLDARP